MTSRWTTLRDTVDHEEGLSLIELLLAITITTILLVPLGYAFYFGLHGTGDTETRLLQSNKATVLASFFAPDVQNAIGAQLNQSDAATCGAAAAKTANLLLTLADGTTVSYYVVPGIGPNPGSLWRRPCNGAPQAQIRLIASLAATQPVPNVFSCDTGGCSGFNIVNATVKQQDAAGGNMYTTSLQASRRVA
jgi:hypothetical protein